MVAMKGLWDEMSKLFASLASSSASSRTYSARAWNEKVEGLSEFERRISGRGTLVRWRYVRTRMYAPAET
jgi:hypothetical protein